MSRIKYIPYKLSHGGREKYFRVDRKKDLVGDCAIRASALALEQDYMLTLRELSDIAINEFGIPSANSSKALNFYMESKGWEKVSLIKNRKKKRMYEFKPILSDNENYIFDVKVGYGAHWTSVVKGVNLDTWLCQDKYAHAYWKKSKTTFDLF